jgi:hypothetical protein
MAEVFKKALGVAGTANMDSTIELMEQWEKSLAWLG